MSDQEKQKGQLNIELDEEIAQGTYSNLAIINHSVSEFVVDFINVMPVQKFLQIYAEAHYSRFCLCKFNQKSERGQ